MDSNNERTSNITLRFKGEMIWVEESNAILFIGSPNITNLDEMYRKVYSGDSTWNYKYWYEISPTRSGLSHKRHFVDRDVELRLSNDILRIICDESESSPQLA